MVDCADPCRGHRRARSRAGLPCCCDSYACRLSEDLVPSEDDSKSACTINHPRTQPSKIVKRAPAVSIISLERLSPPHRGWRTGGPQGPCHCRPKASPSLIRLRQWRPSRNKQLCLNGCGKYATPERDQELCTLAIKCERHTSRVDSTHGIHKRQCLFWRVRGGPTRVSVGIIRIQVVKDYYKRR